ncbi:MAG: M20 family metallopeptidase [Alphaproteobacteria bacterium]|nr:M20 family metallopeptidase [Alphaproteobacteria bacterium]
MSQMNLHPRRTMWATLLVLAVVQILSSAALADETAPAWQTVLERIVDINSGTQNVEGLDAVRAVLIPEFEKLGFEAAVHDLDDGHKLVSMAVPGGAPELLLMGHIDTVFQKDSAFQNYATRGDRIYGPGVIDMKSGIVMMLDLLRKFEGIERLKKFIVILSDDEEIGSPYSRSLVKELVTGIKSGLVFEPGLPDGAVVTSQSGVLWLTLSVEGKAAHAGLEPEKGLNACVELSHKVVEISTLSDYAKKLPVNVGVIDGRSKPNVVCERAEAKIDIRYVDKEDLDLTVAKIRDITAKSYVYNDYLKAAPTAELETIVAVPSMPEARTARLFGLLEAAGESIGQTVAGRHVGYASDANRLAQTGMDLLVGLGPYGAGMHTDQEYLTISTYQERLALTEALVGEILK